MPMYNHLHAQLQRQRQQVSLQQQESLHQLQQQQQQQQQPLSPWQAHVISGLVNHRRDLYFRGNFGGSTYGCRGQQVASCSPGIRPWVQAYARARPEAFSGVNDTTGGSDTSSSTSASDFGMGMMGGARGERRARGARKEAGKAATKGARSEGGWLALCPSGAGCWSTRLYDAISHLVVPVVRLFRLENRYTPSRRRCRVRCSTTLLLVVPLVLTHPNIFCSVIFVFPSPFLTLRDPCGVFVPVRIIGALQRSGAAVRAVSQLFHFCD